MKADDSGLVRWAKTRTCANEWVELPGPAWWWKKYDHEKHGWVPDSDPRAAKRAFDLITNEFTEFPDDAYLIAPSDQRLYLVGADVAILLAKLSSN